MRSTRIPGLGLIVIVSVLGGMSTSSALADSCYRVKPAEVSEWRSRRPILKTCTGVNRGTSGFAEVEGSGMRVPTEPGIYCFRVSHMTEPSKWLNDNCTTMGGTEGGFVKIQDPTYNPPPPRKKFQAASGTVKFEAGETVLECKSSKSQGEITEAAAVVSTKTTYTGCVGGEKGEKCTVKSTGGGEGLISSNLLQGELVEVATSEATSGVGLELEPATGKRYAVITGACISESPIEGKIIGEATPVETLQTTSKLIYATTSKKQQIQKSTESTSKEVLRAFGGLIEVALAAKYELTFEEAVEVT